MHVLLLPKEQKIRVLLYPKANPFNFIEAPRNRAVGYLKEIFLIRRKRRGINPKNSPPSSGFPLSLFYFKDRGIEGVSSLKHRQNFDQFSLQQFQPGRKVKKSPRYSVGFLKEQVKYY
jgi:hypothetical protein